MTLWYSHVYVVVSVLNYYVNVYKVAAKLLLLKLK